jgi:indole-3-glycerol phosphate synthase
MNRLTEILNYKKREVEKKKAELDLQKLRERITKRFDQRSFAQALRQEHRVALIAEVKKASPSAGIIRPDFHPTSIARSYEEGGANALSVLTDEKFFQGHLKYLLQARSATNLPCLRKDFVIDEYQIWEARLAEADAVLLIVAALTPKELMDFQGVAMEAELDALVEVHDEKELDIALEVGARIIGINNRNLQTFEVDLKTTEQLVPKIPKGTTIVSESGIQTADHLKRLRDIGVHAVLVGESLMRQKDVAEATKKLLAID